MRSAALLVAAQTGLGRNTLTACAVSALLGMPGGTWAQDAPSLDAAAPRSYALTPRLSTTATVTNNISHLGEGVVDGALVIQLSPGLRFSSNAGRLRGFVDYALSGVSYIKSPVRGEFQNALTAALTAEAVENWAYVDFSSSITQQAISAFGPQTVGNGLGDVNRAEVWSANLSPNVRGNLGNVARYNARLNLGMTNTRKSALADAHNSALQLSVGGLSGRSLLNWSLESSLQRQTFKLGRHTENDSARGVLQFAAHDDLQLIANAGVESNNLQSSGREQHSTYGLGLNWTPTERTKLSMQRDHRFFGEAHSISFEHRMARSIWRFTDSKDVSNNTGQSGGTSSSSPGTNYELYYGLYASLVPDPVQRQAYVLDYLRSVGLNPSASPVGGFLSSAVSVVRRRELSLALTGVRDTVTILATRTENRRLDSLSQVQDDLSNSARVSQTGLIFSLSHRLTPQASANLTLSQQKTAGVLATQSSTMRSILANWSASLGARTSLSLGARYVVFKATVNPYNEKALFANLNRQF
nr:TIGR03016 family PEP-CTERM system-associated outer membrane protein [uncultured Roseateles sp.]